MSFTVTPISQRLPVINGTKVVEKAAFAPLVTEVTIGRKVTWDTRKFELKSAKLNVGADQDVTSGASLTVIVNESVLDPVIRWNAFETQDQKQSYDVLSQLLRGQNTFVFSYEVSGLHQLAATARVNATLDLNFDPLQPGDQGDSTPADSGTEGNPNSFNDFWTSVKNNAKTISVLGIVIGTFLGIGYLYYKTTHITDLLGKVRTTFR